MPRVAWHELFPVGREPSMEDVADYVGNPLWDAFIRFVDEAYGAQPRIEYSRCGAAPGWNVKYKARGRALCTVYPRDGFFICMVSISMSMRGLIISAPLFGYLCTYLLNMAKIFEDFVTVALREAFRLYGGRSRLQYVTNLDEDETVEVRPGFVWLHGGTPRVVVDAKYGWKID